MILTKTTPFFGLARVATLITGGLILLQCDASSILAEDSEAPEPQTVVLESGLSPRDVTKRSYLSYVTECADLLMQYGTDRYGPKHAPILVSILDVRTRNCPENPAPCDEKWRVTRRNRRNPAAANMLVDQPTIKALHHLSAASGDNRYARFANTHMDYYMKNLVDEKGLFWWGWHRWYNVFGEYRGILDYAPHEIHAIHCIAWERLWQVNPQAVRKEIEALWKWHIIDKKTGDLNRHDSEDDCGDFSMSGGAFLYAFAFLYSKTGDDLWLDRSKLVADHYYKSRNEDTDLVHDTPCGTQERFSRNNYPYVYFGTMTTGPHCLSLLKSWELTGVDFFKEYASAYLKAYAKYGFDEASGKFWSSLNADGSHHPGPGPDGEYGQSVPHGHLDLWEPYVAGYEYPIYAAQAFAYAYQLTRDPVFLATAKRFADWIAKELPVERCLEKSWYAPYARTFARYGTHADKYGRTTSFFIHLYALTGEQKYLDLAKKVANEAVSKLYYKGLFRGHPAKPYYEATDGVGFLLYALIELDQALKNPQEVVGKNRIRLGSDIRSEMNFDNW